MTLGSLPRHCGCGMDPATLARYPWMLPDRHWLRSALAGISKEDSRLDRIRDPQLRIFSSPAREA